MNTSKTRSRLGRCMPVLIAALIVGVTVQTAASDIYPETREVLSELVITGHSAVTHYYQSAHQASNENLPHLADLFRAMAASQLVMVRNFERYLTELDGGVSACTLPPIDRSTTRRNLMAAIQNEIRETGNILQAR